MKRKKVKFIKQLGNTGTQLEKEVAAMEEAMKQHNIEENCQKLIDGLMPQIKDMERTLYGTYHRNIIEYSTSRIKTPESIVEKLHRKNREVSLNKAIETLRDLAGIRIICSFQDDIYALEESFLKQDDIELIERKDYIKNPKPSGYRSLHLIVQVPIFLQNTKKFVNVEVQFRTIAMDFWASLEHKMRYKKDIPESQVKFLQEELYDCAEQSAKLDERMQGIRDVIGWNKNE